MAIVIKKRVSLAFLGDDYKEAYLTFQSIPATDFDEVVNSLENIKEKKENSLMFILDILKKYFVSGQFPDNDTLSPVKADDLGGLDPTTIIQCFKIFTGQELDPKVETPLTNSSPTEDKLPENS